MFSNISASLVSTPIIRVSQDRALQEAPEVLVMKPASLIGMVRTLSTDSSMYLDK